MIAGPSRHALFAAAALHAPPVRLIRPRNGDVAPCPIARKTLPSRSFSTSPSSRYPTTAEFEDYERQRTKQLDSQKKTNQNRGAKTIQRPPAELFRPTTDAPFLLKWLPKLLMTPEGRAHLRKRFPRPWPNSYSDTEVVKTRQALQIFDKEGLLVPRDVVKERRPLLFYFNDRYVPKFTLELLEIYAQYNYALARGLPKQVQKISRDKARQTGEKIALHLKNEGAFWEMLDDGRRRAYKNFGRNGPIGRLLGLDTAPRILWATAANLPNVKSGGNDLVVQVCVRFNTLQALTTRQKGRNEQRVMEHWVFERHAYLADGGDWRLKEKVEAEEPQELNRLK